jgi:hypothetical protein
MNAFCLPSSFVERADHVKPLFGWNHEQDESSATGAGNLFCHRSGIDAEHNRQRVAETDGGSSQAAPRSPAGCGAADSGFFSINNLKTMEHVRNNQGTIDRCQAGYSWR